MHTFNVTKDCEFSISCQTEKKITSVGHVDSSCCHFFLTQKLRIMCCCSYIYTYLISKLILKSEAIYWEIDKCRFIFMFTVIQAKAGKVYQTPEY